MDYELLNQLSESFHSLVWAMNLDRIPVHHEGDCCTAKNLSLMVIRILRLVDEHELISLKDIRAAVNIPNSRLTSIINKFEKKNLLTRHIDPNDRRSFLLQITDFGHRVNAGHRKIDLLLAQEFSDRIKDEGRIRQFIEIINTVTKEPFMTMDAFVRVNAEVVNQVDDAP